MKILITIDRLIRRVSPFVAILLLIIVVTGIHLTTISFLPLVRGDEVMLVEAGRCVWGGDPGVSNMIIRDGCGWVYWPGVWMLNFCHEMFPLWGHRIFALIGLSCSALLFYFVAGKIIGKRWGGFWFAAMLLVDFWLTQNTRAARLDSWSITAAIAAIWVVLNGLSDKNKFSHDLMVSIGVAMLMVLSAFIWVGGIFLYPLILVLFWRGLSTKKRNKIDTHISMCLCWNRGSGVYGRNIFDPLFFDRAIRFFAANRSLFVEFEGKFSSCPVYDYT